MIVDRGENLWQEVEHLNNGVVFDIQFVLISENMDIDGYCTNKLLYMSYEVITYS